MQSETNLLTKLIDSLCYLPGIGPKSAQRLAFYLLQNSNKQKGIILADVLQKTINNIKNCKRCRAFSEQELCSICNNYKRDSSILCIVETQADIFAIEQTNSYSGKYFVLMGHLSPIDGIGPHELGINELSSILETDKQIKEVIIATNPTVEGEATSHFLVGIIRSKQLKCSRIAHGIPLGGELEYINTKTLAKALLGRIDITE